MFETLRERLLSLDGPARLFFRDDDADRDVSELRTLLRVFAERNAPVNLAVIPGTLAPGGARLLREASALQPLELHQHGWMHVNHEREGRKCEFGPARAKAEQRGDIERGKQRLNDLLEGAAVPIFTPPWNRCTRATCEALAELEFRAVSTIRQTAMVERPAALGDVAVSVDLFRWKGGAALKSEEDLTTEISARLEDREPVGILLHHKAMSSDAFAMVSELLEALQSAQARFHTMEELCPSRD